MSLNQHFSKLMYGTLACQDIKVWEGQSHKVGGHSFVWTDHIASDMSEASFVRISLKGTNDSYMAIAEEKQRKSKMITYVIGGWGNSQSTVKFLQKNSGDRWHGNPGEPYAYAGKVHNG